MCLTFTTEEVLTQERWTFEYHATFPYNIPLPLNIHQRDYPDIDLTAHYSSEALVIPICWLSRITYWSGNGCWALQAIHHKLYLDNRSSEVLNFSITHGFNLITVSHGRKFGDYIVRVAAGIVLAHPENTIRGKHLPEDQGIFNWGYYIAGPTIDLSVGRQIKLPWRLYLVYEAMVNVSYASVPVVDGRAKLYNLAARLNVGVGINLTGDE